MLKIRRSKISIWSCQLMVLDRYWHVSTCSGNPSSTSDVFSVLHSSGCCVVSIPALRQGTSQGNDRFVDRSDLYNMQWVSSAHQHFYKLLCPCLSEGKSLLLLIDETQRIMCCSKDLAFIFFEGISLTVLHMWMIDGFPYFYLYLK